MVDTSIKNTGNSRSLRTVSNALTLYPTHEAMIAAMVNGTFPIDLGPLNAAGLNVKGTDLNKGNLFSDAAAANFGLGANGTPDQAFRKLVPMLQGSYIGTGGGNTEATAKSLTFEILPKLLILFINPNYSYPIGVFMPSLMSDNGTYYNGAYRILGVYPAVNTIIKNDYLRAKRAGNTISWYCSYEYPSSSGFNLTGETVYYIGFI